MSSKRSYNYDESDDDIRGAFMSWSDNEGYGDFLLFTREEFKKLRSQFQKLSAERRAGKKYEWLRDFNGVEVPQRVMDIKREACEILDAIAGDSRRQKRLKVEEDAGKRFYNDPQFLVALFDQFFFIYQRQNFIAYRNNPEGFLERLGRAAVLKGRQRTAARRIKYLDSLSSSNIARNKREGITRVIGMTDATSDDEKQLDSRLVQKLLRWRGDPFERFITSGDLNKRYQVPDDNEDETLSWDSEVDEEEDDDMDVDDHFDTWSGDSKEEEEEADDWRERRNLFVVSIDQVVSRREVVGFLLSSRRNRLTAVKEEVRLPYGVPVALNPSPSLPKAPTRADNSRDPSGPSHPLPLTGFPRGVTGTASTGCGYGDEVRISQKILLWMWISAWFNRIPTGSSVTDAWRAAKNDVENNTNLNITRPAHTPFRANNSSVADSTTSKITEELSIQVGAGISVNVRPLVLAQVLYQYANSKQQSVTTQHNAVDSVDLPATNVKPYAERTALPPRTFTPVAAPLHIGHLPATKGATTKRILGGREMYKRFRMEQCEQERTAGKLVAEPDFKKEYTQLSQAEKAVCISFNTASLCFAKLNGAGLEPAMEGTIGIDSDSSSKAIGLIDNIVRLKFRRVQEGAGGGEGEVGAEKVGVGLSLLILSVRRSSLLTCADILKLHKGTRLEHREHPEEFTITATALLHRWASPPRPFGHQIKVSNFRSVLASAKDDRWCDLTSPQNQQEAYFCCFNTCNNSNILSRRFSSSASPPPNPLVTPAATPMSIDSP
ncbi:hypothetical protein BT69DRAFT_1330570 [Atractiella rhizophila]|nr:hypothetical protein BT69DRAFT_1330570 [Atractiella rhizophila]